MKNIFAVLLYFLLAAGVFAQRNSASQNVPAPPKYALVIGNAAYAGSARLKNPVNDAYDMAAALEELGFNVDKVFNGSLDEMENAIDRLTNRLSVTKNAYGFLFYAGHGVQSNGENYLIPVGANISNENYLRQRAVSVQTMLAGLNNAGNALNVIVLDACRDNPFDWARGRGGSGNRGLSVVSNQPADSILVYATSAGSTAADGIGRNGVFTGELLKNIRTPGIEVAEVFRLTMGDVILATDNKQRPAVYNQFSGLAYLGSRPVETAIAQPVPAPQPAPARPVQPAPQPVPAQPAPAPQPAPVQPAPARPAPAPPAPPAAPVQPVQPDKPEKERDPVSDKAAKLNSLSLSVGTTFAIPWFVTSISGTLAPSRNSFFDIGIDLGLVSGYDDVIYVSFYPFAHYAFFIPFNEAGGWYAGAGAGVMMATYNFHGGDMINENTFAVDFGTGVIISNMFNISYTLRTNFTSASNKFSIGYIKRF